MYVHLVPKILPGQKPQAQDFNLPLLSVLLSIIMNEQLVCLKLNMLKCFAGLKPTVSILLMNIQQI